MEPKQFEIKFSELGVAREKVAKILRFGEGEIPPHFMDLIDHELLRASELSEIVGGYLVIEPVLVDKKRKLITLGNVDFMVGKNISVYLQHARKLALLLCTAGPKLEERSQHLIKEGHYPEGFINDVIGSIVADLAMDMVHERLTEDMKKAGLKVSNIYSPGYCLWDVSEQQKLFSFFPDKFLGITLSESSLMNPIKSVSSISGIGRDIKKFGYACDICTMADCTFRNLK